MIARTDASRVGRSLFATLLAMIGCPILWILLVPVFGTGSDAVLYALAAAMVLCMAAYAGTLSLLRYWSR